MSDQDSSSPSLRPILLRFAAQSAAIRELVARDEGFRSLVEDYILTLNTLRKLKRDTLSNRNAIAEYASILTDLDGEIIAYLTQVRQPDP